MEQNRKEYTLEELLDTTAKRSQIIGKPDAIESIVILLAKAGGLDDIKRSLPGASKTDPKRFLAAFIKCARLDAENQSKRGKDPQLARCSLASILEALKLAAMVDVVPGDGRAYLIGYGGECKFDLGAHGMRDVMRRSSAILDINDQCVYEGDDFEAEMDGPNRGVRHIRRTFGKDRKWLCTYCTIKLAGDPRPIVELIDELDMDLIKGQSKNPTGLPWTKFVDEHSRAKVLRRVSKRVPMRPDDAAALQAIDAANFLMGEATKANERDLSDRITGEINMEDLKTSTDPNRGHGQTAPQPEAKPEPTDQELDSLFAQDEKHSGKGTAAALK